MKDRYEQLEDLFRRKFALEDEIKAMLSGDEPKPRPAQKAKPGTRPCGCSVRGRHKKDCPDMAVPTQWKCIDCGEKFEESLSNCTECDGLIVQK